jgi:hypothetical protein
VRVHWHYTSWAATQPGQASLASLSLPAIVSPAPPGRDSGGVPSRPGRPPRRVFISHTSDHHPALGQPAHVAAARSAVIRAGEAMIDMAFFTAHAADPADYCARMVATADVYVGIVGYDYGSPVRGRPEVSYSELEFEAASRHGLPRLVFLREDAPERRSSPALDPRQAAFRRRLRDAGLTTGGFASPAQLETRLYQALVELPDDRLPGPPLLLLCPVAALPRMVEPGAQVSRTRCPRRVRPGQRISAWIRE